LWTISPDIWFYDLFLRKLMTAKDRPGRIDRPAEATAWSPLRHSTFRALWIANLASNTGTWVQATATAWLMTILDPSPIMVSLVQTATSLPIFLLALPAGALADVLDRRRVLLFTQTWMLIAAASLGLLALAGFLTPWVLLSLTLMLGLGHAMNAPTWQAIVPELVERHEILPAVALNSAGFNAARSVGPALGGLIVGMAGASVAFILNAASFLGIILVILSWKRPPRSSALPAERMIGAMRTGIRYVRNAPALKAVLIRATAFSLCASSIMALLPLLARQELNLGSLGYGTLLGFFGFGAVAGAAVLQAVRRRVSLDRLSLLSSVIFAGMLALTAHVRVLPLVCGSLFIGGAAWLAILSGFNSSVQSVVPAWVRGRALAVYMLTLFGGMALGSAFWGIVAGFWGVPMGLTFSSGSLILGMLLTMRYRLADAEMLDLTPSMHWPSPALPVEPNPNHGPVLITVEYRIDPVKTREFTEEMARMRMARLRYGAMGWSLFADAERPGHYTESFITESWVEHLRQHERVTVADLQIERGVASFHIGKRPPRVSHFISVPLPKGVKEKT
jgi:MFS family permease